MRFSIKKKIEFSLVSMAHPFPFFIRSREKGKGWVMDTSELCLRTHLRSPIVRFKYFLKVEAIGLTLTRYVGEHLSKKVYNNKNWPLTIITEYQNTF